jgi:hypothetical protein
MPAEDRPAARWLKEHWEEMRPYNFYWLAATAEDGVVHRSASLQSVIDEVVARGLAEQVVYAFVDFEERH